MAYKGQGDTRKLLKEIGQPIKTSHILAVKKAEGKPLRRVLKR